MINGLIHACLSTALAMGVFAFFAVPNALRAFAPDLDGFVEISPTLHIDDPAAATRVQGLIRQAEAETQGFFGPLQTNPVWVVCTTPSCARAVSLRANGLTYGYTLIVLGPRGINQRTATHERVHAELHQYIGLEDILEPKFPAWFDEGLATYLSGDTRLRGPANPREADWIREARRLTDWRRLGITRDWNARYSAASRLVEEIEDMVGRDGLQDLIRRVGEDGVSFDQALAEAMGR